MAELQTRYITYNDFKDYFQIDLVEKLGNTNKAVGFIKRIEDRMELFVNANFNRNINNEYPTFTDEQKAYYKQALLEQCIYIFRNSDISVDSGYDVEKGIVVQRKDIINLSIAPNSKQALIMAGIWNRHLRYARNGGGVFNGGFFGL